MNIAFQALYKMTMIIIITYLLHNDNVVNNKISYMFCRTRCLPNPFDSTQSTDLTHVSFVVRPIRTQAAGRRHNSAVGRCHQPTTC